jgi:hypothetical protein
MLRVIIRRARLYTCIYTIRAAKLPTGKTCTYFECAKRGGVKGMSSLAKLIVAVMLLAVDRPAQLGD